MKRTTKKSRLNRKVRQTISIFVLSFVVGALITGCVKLFNGPDYTLTGYKEVVVHSGDTLWTLATEEQPQHMNLNEYMYEVNKINDANIHPGDVVKLPVFKEIK